MCLHFACIWGSHTFVQQCFTNALIVVHTKHDPATWISCCDALR